MDTDDTNIEFVFGVGGEDKKNSSSWILQEWKAPKTIRPWGYYRVLHTVGKNVKVKELTVDPGKTLSMQRHKYRSELWFVAEGTASNNWEFGGRNIKPYKTEIINPMEWHQLHNSTEQPLKVIEIQYGEQCEEEDIERK
jgi:mannose-6-phosphate isomerase-like protein (cupin superfamily)